MKRFIQGEHRGQSTLLPESLDDYVSDTNPVRVVDVFVDELDLVNLRFEGVIPADTGRPAYHPAILLKIYIYGYLNRIQSSRRLEREAQHNVELMWLAGLCSAPKAPISGKGSLIRSIRPGRGGNMVWWPVLATKAQSWPALSDISRSASSAPKVKAAAVADTVLREAVADGVELVKVGGLYVAQLKVANDVAPLIGRDL